MHNTPESEKTFPLVEPKPNDSAAKPKPPKRDKIFSKSRDIHEDRGTRQMKTSHESHTQSHGK